MRVKIVILMLMMASTLQAKESSPKPMLSDPESFSIVVLPDLQSYAKFDVNHSIMDMMLQWTASQLDNLNVKAVLCTGDLVEQNQYIVIDERIGNQTGTEQWVAASKAFEPLDNRVLYMTSLGNHDYGYVAAENRETQFAQYFPIERNSLWKKSVVSVCNNAFGVPTLENAAFEIETEHWGKLLLINSEFAPRDEVLDWAKSLCEEKRFKDHTVIFLTHSYLSSAGERIVHEQYELSEPNYGEAIWNKLVSPTSNIRMVICGHECCIGSYEENVSQRMDLNQAGRNVFQMMFNAQTADGSWFGNGGDGWLRTMEFMPDGKSVKIKTYSPLFGISPKTSHLAWRREAYDEFEIKIK